MKKLFVVLLAVLVLGSVAMVAIACGEEETTETQATEETTAPSEVTTTEAASTALTPAEVLAIGEQVVADYTAAGEDAV